MEKLISKDAVIKLTWENPSYSDSVNALTELRDKVNTLPSVPVQKTGKWIVVHGYATPGGDPVWRCSECGKGQHVYGIENASYGADIADHQWVACPNCGAVMRDDNI